jgi:hypothetical protein
MERDEYLIEGALPLARREELRITDGRELLIHVWQGSLWITQEGDTRDIVLEAGDSFRLDRNGVALAKAWDDTVLALASPHEKRPARDIAVRPPQAGAGRAPAGARLGGLLPHAA